MAGNILKVITWNCRRGTSPLGYYRALAAIGLSQLASSILDASSATALGLQGVAIAYDLCWAWTFAVEMFVVVAIGRVGPRPRDCGMRS